MAIGGPKESPIRGLWSARNPLVNVRCCDSLPSDPPRHSNPIPAAFDRSWRLPVEGENLLGSGVYRGDERIAWSSRKPAPTGDPNTFGVREPFHFPVTHPHPTVMSGSMSSGGLG
jgi:hypothetical protein